MTGSTPTISYVVPTHQRHETLADTLHALGRLEAHDADVVVVDNASVPPIWTPPVLPNGLPVRTIHLSTNEGAAARNLGAREASGEWIVMLDDDSHPTSLDFLDGLRDAPADVGAIMADIHLPRAGTREMGGLPEVFIGCGVAIRRGLFLDLGGYDRAFEYYVEEYDLAARLLASGHRVEFMPTFRVEHHKVTTGRDFARIVERLVRNNGWVIERYAPESIRRALHRSSRTRYRTIARKESASAGYARAIRTLRATVKTQRRTPLPPEAWDRFTGLAAAREALASFGGERCTIVARGKHDWVVERALEEVGAHLVEDGRPVIGTMSPGPMIDALVAIEGATAPWVVASRVVAGDPSGIREPKRPGRLVA